MVKVTQFDAAKFLNTDEERAMYLSEFLHEDILSEEFIAALNDVARSIGMTKIAEEAGIGRESLYKTLSAKKPRFDTMLKIIHALGMDLQITATRKACNMQ
ncbi:addiction module antidote protein [Gilliamella bombi]|uniref:addiction module antidote protein n=1 Tax=Gilliamella bombi TaxID=1908521 RepID=UPI000A15F788|nr:addiction module antidote protein [Gilliamella bombi]